MTEPDTDVVYSPASITNPGLVHTERDCPRLQRANRVLEHPASAYPADVETCDWCAGEDVIADDGPSGPWEDLESMDPDDLVTDGGQCRWTGDCRNCGKRVSTRTDGTGETEHCVRVRCSECGTTNYLTERTDLGPLRADGGSKYVRETGAGYQAVYTVSSSCIAIQLATCDAVDWAVGDTIHARLGEDGVVLSSGGPDELGRYEVRQQTRRAHSGTEKPVLELYAPVKNALGLANGDDARVYDHPDGLEVVDASDDPRIMTDGGTGPWYRCICGARYRNAGAAIVCCTDEATGSDPFEGGDDT